VSGVVVLESPLIRALAVSVLTSQTQLPPVGASGQNLYCRWHTLNGQSDLTNVAHATDAVTFLFRNAKGGQEQRSEDGNNRDDDKQFNEGKGCALAGKVKMFPRE